ncbi:conserved hypothetical protein [Methanosalsum zhilinae DSM 4017]|uniref:Uncharacterized protein n=1 Tax=Methanosalsum zhilinae (strain DSM 4017 / NBRC 107636 / OCM 62 / WeN5) TaxID=679901 RepID=F7XLC8_METZD|nr:hypothetical protein [Methanosalsum zhilinae]AEH60787.1 conserved hypothetical protein [Methanosalsum zhilinae DSM 4017]
MKCEYDIETNILNIDGNLLEPCSLDENETGSCISCSNKLISISYHQMDNPDIGKANIVVSECDGCRSIFASLHDGDWNWIDDIQVSDHLESTPLQKITPLNEHSKKESSLKESVRIEDIPEEKLRAVFSPKELEAIYAKYNGNHCVRQYLYRARKKYSKFKKLFGIELNI